jgi:hypothetical protein
MQYPFAIVKLCGLFQVVWRDRLPGTYFQVGFRNGETNGRELRRRDNRVVPVLVPTSSLRFALKDSLVRDVSMRVEQR